MTPLSHIVGLSVHSYPEVKPFPKIQAILEAFNYLQATFCAFVQKMQRIWRVLNLLSAWGLQMLHRIMSCYQTAQEDNKIEPAQLGKVEIHKKQDLQEIFNEPILYEQFRDTILSVRKKGELFYGNYSLETYCGLEECDFKTILSFPTEEERELHANIAIYDAIVNLYVSRILKENSELNDEKYLPSLRTIALAIAIKISWDERMWNVNFARFISPYLGVDKHKQMESEFLRAIDWNLSTDELLFKPRSIEMDDPEMLDDI